jgi:hypothetical protein
MTDLTFLLLLFFQGGEGGFEMLGLNMDLAGVIRARGPIFANRFEGGLVAE